MPNESNSPSAMERMWLCVAFPLQSSLHRLFSEHCGWLSLQTGIQSNGEIWSQNPESYPNNINWKDHIFLGCRPLRLFSTHKQTKRMSQKHKPLNEKNNLDKKQNNWEPIRNNLRWKKMRKNLQRSMEIIQYNPLMESKQMHDYE